MSDDQVEQLVEGLVGDDPDLEHVAIVGTSRGQLLVGLSGFPAARVISSALEQREGYLQEELPPLTPEEENVISRFDEGLRQLGTAKVGCVVCYHLVGSQRYHVAWSSVLCEDEARDELMTYLQNGLP